MPPRTYDFSSYQGGLESFLNGAGSGINGITEYLRRQKLSQQNDAVFEQQMQDEIDNRIMRRGQGGYGIPGQSVTDQDPLGLAGRRLGPFAPAGGAGRTIGGFAGPYTIPNTSPGVGDAAPGATPAAASAQAPQAPPSGLFGAMKTHASRLLQGLQTGGYQAPQFDRIQKTGPSAAELQEDTRFGHERSLHELDNTARASENDADNAARLRELQLQIDAGKYDRSQRASETNASNMRTVYSGLMDQAQSLQREAAQLDQQAKQIEANTIDQDEANAQLTPLYARQAQITTELRGVRSQMSKLGASLGVPPADPQNDPSQGILQQIDALDSSWQRAQNDPSIRDKRAAEQFYRAQRAALIGQLRGMSSGGPAQAQPQARPSSGTSRTF